MIVKHYKGGFYEVLAETKVANGYVDCKHMIEAKHTETGEKIVAKRDERGKVYTQDEEFVIYTNDGYNIWARPRKMFWEHLVYEGEIVSRFVIIEGAKIGE